jgi:hypothetical protein
MAGGHWPERARVAAVALVADAKQSTPSLGVRLLADLRDVGDADVMATESILTVLHNLAEAPWADLKGKKAAGCARVGQPLSPVRHLIEGCPDRRLEKQGLQTRGPLGRLGSLLTPSPPSHVIPGTRDIRDNGDAGPASPTRRGRGIARNLAKQCDLSTLR